MKQHWAQPNTKCYPYSHKTRETDQACCHAMGIYTAMYPLAVSLAHLAWPSGSTNLFAPVALQQRTYGTQQAFPHPCCSIALLGPFHHAETEVRKSDISAISIVPRAVATTTNFDLRTVHYGLVYGRDYVVCTLTRSLVGCLSTSGNTLNAPQQHHIFRKTSGSTLCPRIQPCLTN